MANRKAFKVSVMFILILSILSVFSFAVCEDGGILNTGQLAGGQFTYTGLYAPISSAYNVSNITVFYPDVATLNQIYNISAYPADTLLSFALDPITVNAGKTILTLNFTNINASGGVNAYECLQYTIYTSDNLTPSLIPSMMMIIFSVVCLGAFIFLFIFGIKNQKLDVTMIIYLIIGIIISISVIIAGLQIV